jgi:hypothetical protein
VKNDILIAVATALLILGAAIIRLLGWNVDHPIASLIPLFAAGLIIAMPLLGSLRQKKCVHNWQPHVRHRSHDVGLMADKCSRCGTEKHYLG